MLKPQWFHILFALAQGPRHGSAIMEDVLQRTNGEMKLWPATLYGSLRDLEELDWITETDPTADAPTEGGRRRFHDLTAIGREELGRELLRLRGILDAAYERDILPEPRAAE